MSLTDGLDCCTNVQYRGPLFELSPSTHQSSAGATVTPAQMQNHLEDCHAD
jgi:hypothetical protein